MTAPPLTEILHQLITARGRGPAARSVELFGWLDLCLGNLIFFAPALTASLLRLPPLGEQAENYLRLVGMLVSGLGMLYVVSGRLNATGFVFASMVDRPLVPAVMLILWRRHIIPGPLALAFSVSDFGGFLFTIWAWRAERRSAAGAARSAGPLARMVAGVFGFTSGVVRNSRTFHPDGRTFLGTVHALAPDDASLARAAEQLSGNVLMRMGMGLLKRGMPRWLALVVPDAPSIALRFYTAAAPGEVRLVRRPGEDLDLLCTAGGDRLWKLILNLSAGGIWFGLDRFNYFSNFFYAEVPHRIDEGNLDVWVRLAPTAALAETTAGLKRDAPGREEGLTRASTGAGVIHLEAQRTGGHHQPFVPFAEIRFDREITVDQETLHFDPGAGRGFVAHGFLSRLRDTVYPACVLKRPPNQEERERRDRAGILRRLRRFLD
jgi:hypothetical protein